MPTRNFRPDWRALYHFLRDPKADWKPKFFLVLVVLYLIWPLDLVPDLAPVLGWLDDVGFTTLALTYLIYASKKYLAKPENQKLIQIENNQDEV